MFANDFARNYKKNNTLNIRRLVNETIVPSTHRPSYPAYYIEDCRIFLFLAQTSHEGNKRRAYCPNIYNVNLY